MELRHLSYFVAVATQLNFTRAADSLLVSQSALSKQIADLEREVGTPLLERNKRVVRLTPAGRVFFEDAQVILERADAAKERATRVARGEEGELSIGFFSAPVIGFLPDLIREYRTEHPQVKLYMKELTPDKQLTAFAKEDIDVGFTRPLPPGYPELSTETLFHERWVAVVSKSHCLAGRRRIRLSDLACDSFVLLERRVAIGLHDHVISACQKDGFSPAVTQTPELMTTVLTLVAAEQGVSVVPEGVRNLQNQQVVFLPISPGLDRFPLIICWRTRDTSPLTEAFRKLVCRRMSQIVKSGSPDEVD